MIAKPGWSLWGPCHRPQGSGDTASAWFCVLWTSLPCREGRAEAEPPCHPMQRLPLLMVSSLPWLPGPGGRVHNLPLPADHSGGTLGCRGGRNGCTRRKGKGQGGNLR